MYSSKVGRKSICLTGCGKEQMRGCRSSPEQGVPGASPVLALEWPYQSARVRGIFVSPRPAPRAHLTRVIRCARILGPFHLFCRNLFAVPGRQSCRRRGNESTFSAHCPEELRGVRAWSGRLQSHRGLLLLLGRSSWPMPSSRLPRTRGDASEA